MIDSAKTAASLQESEDAFVRELPSLLRDHEGKWIAYHGFRRVTVAGTKAEAYAECYRQGLCDDDFLVRCIEPPLEEMILGPDAQTG